MTAAPGTPGGAFLPRAPRAVLFDLDDTLYPEHAFVDGGFRAVAAMLAPRLGAGKEDLAARLWALHARDGRGRLFDSLLAEHGLVEDPDLVLACLLVYRTHRARLFPFAGVEGALVALGAAGIRLGVVSDGNAAVQHRKLAGLGRVAALFETVVMTDELGSGLAKPSPVPFRVACRLLDIPPADAVYVGNDPRKDFRGARAAGLSTIRAGRVPDEGGGRAIAFDPADDADLAIDDFSGLAALLAPAPQPGAGAPSQEVTL
jgi:putative hydrolase of the HAD superfamily